MIPADTTHAENVTTHAKNVEKTRHSEKRGQLTTLL
jgi:hypothetical protein